MFFGGFPTTAATYLFRDYVPSYNAELVDQALQLGAVTIGKTNLHEIALGGTSAASYFGPVRNPRDPSRVSGGSSGGSAVAVAMAKTPVLGFGTDTGGSIRVPAALCGIVGFKPTLGALSLRGVFPLSATLDHPGLLTRTVPDARLAFERLTGRRESAGEQRGRTRVGVLAGHFLAGTEDRVARNFWNALQRLESSGKFTVKEIQTDSSFERFTAARAAIQLKEAAWFYSDLASRSVSKVNPDVVTLLKRGMKVGHVRYLVANLVRLECIRAFEGLMKGFDCLATPTTRIVSPKLDQVLGNEAGDLRRMLLQNTEVFNLNGFPALCMPTNPRTSELPTSIQLSGRLGQDSALLRAGELAEAAIASRSS